MILKGFARLLTVGLILVLSGSARSDDGDGRRALDSLIQLAFRQNPSLAAMEYQIASGEQRTKFAGGLPDPMMSLGLMDVPRGSFSLGEMSMSGLVVGLTQEIPWPGRSSLESRMAHLSVQRDRAGTEAMRNELTRMVASAYTEYSFWVRRREIVVKAQELVRDMRAAAETEYAHGRGSAPEILRAGAEIDMLDNELAEADQMRQSALIEIARLVGDSDVIADSLPVFLPEPEGAKPVDETEPAADSNPIALRAARQTEIASSELSLVRTNYWPDLMIGVDYRIRKDMEMDPDRGKDLMSFMVGFKIPLWFFRNQKHQTAATREELLMAQSDERSVRDILTQRRRDAALMLRSLSERIGRYDSSILPQSRSALEAARASYEVGAAEFGVVLDAHQALLEMETTRLELARDYNVQRAVLTELSSSQSGR